MDLWKVIIGIFTAAFLILFRNAQITAQKQRVIAVRLRSYLLYWNKWVLDNDMFNIFYLGMKWNKEIREILNRGGGAEDLVKLEEEKKKMVDEIKNKIENEIEKNGLYREEIVEQLKRNSENTSELFLKYGLQIEQNLLDGKIFISDEDASYLGVHIARTCIEMKMNLISMTNQGVSLVHQNLSDPENFDVKVFASNLSKIYWKAILVSRDIDALIYRIDFYTKESLFKLILRNLRQ